MSLRAFNWYMQRITGALLLLLLIMHFWVEHFAADVRARELDWEMVQQRFFHNPWFLWVDISFLIVALYHGLYGMRNILFDYSVVSRNPLLKKGIIVGLWVIGLVWAWWGIGAFYQNEPFFHPKQASVRVEEHGLKTRATVVASNVRGGE